MFGRFGGVVSGEGSGLSLHGGGGPTGDYYSEGSIEGTRHVSHCPGEQRSMVVLNGSMEAEVCGLKSESKLNKPRGSPFRDGR